MNMKFQLSRSCLYLLIAAVVIAVFYGLFSFSTVKPKEVNISEIVQQVNSGQVKQIEVTDNKLLVTLQSGVEEVSYKEATAMLKDYGLTSDKVKIEVKNSSGGDIWFNLFTAIFPVVIIAGFLWFMMRQAQSGNNQAMSFGKSRARLVVPSQKKITFEDVAGSDEAKQELLEVVEFLKHGEKFKSLGAEIPKGLLLLGPPGTGKTLMAKAVAGEADVPFFSISGSEFVEMFVGVGASRVRDLFAKAKKNSPAIVFIDEIDAVGRQRGAGLGGSNDEREQTLNQILVEMDGFDTDTNVIVVAATNRPDILDPALLRPGRFDRRVVLDLPDVRERELILKVHARNKPMDKTVDLAKVGHQTPGFAGADLHNLLNEAAILTARRNKKKIGQAEIIESIEKVMLGPERKSHLLSDNEKKITAYHETGHAIVSFLMPFGDPVKKISIVSRGMAAGYTWSMPDEDMHMFTKSQFESRIASLLGGKAAEEVIFGESSTGAENDLRKATELAREMVKEYGMSNVLGPVTYGRKEELVFLGKEIGEEKTYSEKTAAEIDDEIRKLLENAFYSAKRALADSRSKLELVAATLLSKEVLDGEEFEKLMEGKGSESILSQRPSPSLSTRRVGDQIPKIPKHPKKAPLLAKKAKKTIKKIKQAKRKSTARPKIVKA